MATLSKNLNTSNEVFANRGLEGWAKKALKKDESKILSSWARGKRVGRNLETGKSGILLPLRKKTGAKIENVVTEF